MTDRWLILRMKSRDTLPVVHSLATAGFDVWSPVDVTTRRVPRANVKRRITMPLLPSYAFARADRMGELMALANDPARQHGDFRVLHDHIRVPLVDDASLEPLRLAERKRKPLERGWLPGDGVRLTEGGFAGLSGVVETARGQFAMVAIPGFRMPLKIATWHLLPVEKRKAA